MRWVDTLDVSLYPSIVHLADWGWVDDPLALEEEIDDLLDQNAVPGLVVDSVRSLRLLLNRRKVDDVTIILTDGLGPDTGEEETEE